MKNLFFLLAATLMLASCKKDMTCTCTYPEDWDGLGGEAYTSTTSVTDANGDEQDAFEEACATLDTAAQLLNGSCVID